MIELVVVIVLIGILSAVVAARYSDRAPFDTRSFTDQARAALRFAQKEAIAQNRPVYVVLDGETIRLCFAAGTSCGSTDQVQAPFSIKTDSTCISAGWYCLRRPNSVTLGYSGALAFNALGRPLDTAGTGLQAPISFLISGGGASFTVTIEPETGYVH